QGDALYIYIFTTDGTRVRNTPFILNPSTPSWRTVCAPFLTATLTVDTDIPSFPASSVIDKPSSRTAR
ncbi:MAG: hypothetical protein KAH06_00925, partial [Desulfobacterales bacterium]|nr:hypothetical protein [Desulfobacterales bacterium]